MQCLTPETLKRRSLMEKGNDLEEDFNQIASLINSYLKAWIVLLGFSVLVGASAWVDLLIWSFFKSSHLKAQITQDMHKYLQQSMENWRDDHPIYIQDEAKNMHWLVSMDPGDDMEFLKKQFQEFMAGLMSLPINIPGSRLHREKKKMVELVHKIIEAKGKNRGRSEVAKDVADVLLNDASEELNDDLILDNMIDLMIPGEDSSSLLPLNTFQITRSLSNN
ncbi:unnamed protein product [Camellia sinensis]